MVESDCLPIQTDNILHKGDLAGRDIHKPTTYNIGKKTFEGKSQLDILYAKLEDEKNHCPEFNEIIEELLHFKEYAKNEEVIGLETKLENGNRLAYLRFAEQAKDKFTRKLLKNEYSETAQSIYAFLLAKVYTSFQIHIYPQIDKHPEDYINHLIDACIIKPLEELLGANILRIFEDEIYGMIYFLTGNCHIRWD